MRKNFGYMIVLTAISALRFINSASSARRSTEDFVDIFECTVERRLNRLQYSRIKLKLTEDYYVENRPYNFPTCSK